MHSLEPINPRNSSRRIRTDAAAEYLGLSVSSLEKDRVSGQLKIPFIKAGRAVVYDTADLDAWLADRKRRSTSQCGAIDQD